MLYLLLAIAIGIGATVYLIKKGKIKDTDGDFIPDVIEDKIEDIKEDVLEKVEDISDKIEFHVDAIKKDVGDIIEEAVTKPTAKKRRGRKPAAKKPATSGQGASVLKNKK